MHILIVGENASARFGGEAILPLHYFRMLLERGVDVRLLVHQRNQRELAEIFPHDQDRITYVPDTRLHQWLYAAGKCLPTRVRYFSFGLLISLLTQIKQRRLAKKLVERHGIDLVHQPTPVSPKQPSMLYNVGAPVVIGPMNGGMSYPKAFKHHNRFETAFIKFGRLFASLANRLIPGKRRAALLLVANKRTQSALPRGVASNVKLIHENGVVLSQWPEIDWTSRDKAEHLKLVFLGRLVDCKVVDTLIDALGKLADARVSLEVIGDGPLRKTLEKQAQTLGLQDRITFHGFVPQHHCPRLMSQADALVLPSVHECGGAVVLEAMAMAMPVIVADWGGPTDYVARSCGFLVSVASRDALVDGMANAIEKLQADFQLRATLGRAGRERVEELFDWDVKVGQIIEHYLSVIPHEKILAMQETGVSTLSGT